MTRWTQRRSERIAHVICAVAAVAGLFVSPATTAANAAGGAGPSGGAVVSAEPVSTAVGLDILRRGGNAADAAVATALAMAVVHPQAGNLGGGGFAVVRFSGSVGSLDFRETAPRSARREMFLDREGTPRPDASTVGPLAAGVPGSPAGLAALHQRFGSLPWAEVVEPARRLADDGFTVSERLANTLEEERDLLSRFPETATVWLAGGEPLEAGRRVRLPALATTLGVYAREGAAGLQKGRIAELIVDASRRHGGILQLEDLQDYVPRWRPALEFESFGWRFAAMDLPSSGGYLLAATLGLAERLDWANAPREGPRRPHLLIEIWRRIFADRARLGDPDSTRVDAATLLEAGRLDRLAASIDRHRATPSSVVAGWPSMPPAVGSDETVHLSVIDGENNVVALTTTLNGLFGCGLWVAGAGFFLNNEMDDFAIAPGHPNMFGLIQGPANEVAPGRRMLSSMVPVVGWREEEILALGGRGGSRIPTAVSQVLLAVIADGEGLGRAISEPRIHHQWLPDEAWMEEGALTAAEVAVLREMGHSVVVSTRDAKVNAVRRFTDGSVEAVGDPRGPASGDVLESLARSRRVAGGSRR